jgi:hypothetical protein
MEPTGLLNAEVRRGGNAMSETIGIVGGGLIGRAFSLEAVSKIKTERWTQINAD